MVVLVYYPQKGYLSEISLNTKGSYRQAYTFDWSQNLRKALIFDIEEIPYLLDLMEMHTDLDVTLFEFQTYEVCENG